MNEKHFKITNENINLIGTLHNNLPAKPKKRPGNIYEGPRITFHFIPEEWTKENDYEFYDVVHFHHTSYIAIQDVPANTDINNPEYWIKWADPNAQMQELYDVVMSFNDRLKALENNEDNNDE